MIVLQFNNLRNLNVSLQVGDAVYAVQPETQAGYISQLDQQGFNSLTPLGENRLIGILLDITFNTNGTVTLTVDDSLTTLLDIGYEGTSTIVGTGDFIMFSKYNQLDGDVLGYYAEAKFINNSKQKAELYVVSSEVVINSK